MPIRDLPRSFEPDYSNEPSLHDDPNFLEDYMRQMLQLRLTPLHPDWPPTVFFDPIRFPNETARERILRYYVRTLPGRELQLEALSPADISRNFISKYPQSEEIFRRRGFVADIEVTAFDRKDHHATTGYLARQKAAVCLQLALIDDLLDRSNASQAWKAWRDASLLALHGGSRRLPVPLAERDGVFLPTQVPRKGDKIHLAYTWTADLALRHGHRDSAGLVAAMPDELSEQLRFERRNSHRLFGARPAALLLWQAQALAMLRKTTWQVGLATGTALNKQQGREIKAKNRGLETISQAIQQQQDKAAQAHTKALQIVSRFLQRLKLSDDQGRAPDVEAVYRTVMKQHRIACHQEASTLLKIGRKLNKIQLPENAYAATSSNLAYAFESKLSEVNAGRGEKLYGSDLDDVEYAYNLTVETILIAAIHSATYCPRFDPNDPHDWNDPIYWLQPLALWIGQLKRQRTAILDKSIAVSVLALMAELTEPDLNEPDIGVYVRLIADRLSEEVWAVVRLAAEQMLAQDKPEPLVVVYDWARDPGQPWQAEQRGDRTVVIEGPLLDFPRSQAAFWNETATTLVRAEKSLFCSRHGKRQANETRPIRRMGRAIGNRSVS